VISSRPELTPSGRGWQTSRAAEGEAFQALIKADVFAKMDISYWNEFK